MYNEQKEELNYILELANGKNYDKTPSIKNALELFKKIKEVEKSTGKELEEAKYDLTEIFCVKAEELKRLTKNNIYMLHQSMMVNQIYMNLMGK